MSQAFLTLIQPVLDLPFVRQTRRNHGLEHATITVLSGRVKGLHMAGRSSHTGFVLLGEVETDRVKEALDTALDRMRRGEHSLAVHPNCGTNLVTTGFLTSVVALLGLQGTSRREDSFERLPWLMAAMMFTVLLSQPLGMWLQKHVTTDGDPADLEVLDVTRSEVNWLGQRMTVHRVRTRSA